MTTQPGYKSQMLMLLLLIVASGFAIALVLARALVTGVPWFYFLIWNLLVAWLPFLLAELAFCGPKRPLFLLPAGFLWLIFLPNAFYIVTDLIHLRPFAGVPLWYDAFLLFAFALTGVLLGLLSLQRMQALVAARFGAPLGWLFVAGVLALSSFGIYVGRFLRWNSWDIFTSPRLLLVDIGQHLLTPQLGFRTAVVSGLLFAIILLMYAALTLNGRQPVRMNLKDE